MNGKNRRSKGCWSRGAPSFSLPLRRVRQNPVRHPPIYSPPRFSSSLINNLKTSQQKLVNYFSNYPFINKLERFVYNSNTPYAVIDLYNEDVSNGTVRIRTPGVYKLKENIVFNPNPENDFSPTKQQIADGLYPQHMMGPYHLGFFAAITVETNDVIIDLGGHTIEQSANHNFQQRFYSNIELANAPFIADKGPANFQGAMKYVPANRVMIYNGLLLRSAHHGIHANLANNVILYNLRIEDFEVAGVALNGTTVGVLSKLYIKHNKKDIKTLSTYSQSRFIRKFLDSVQLNNPTAIFNGKSISAIKDKLNLDLADTFQAFKDNITPLPVNYFRNDNIEYDGNVYGLVLNVNGPVVGAFLTKETLAQAPQPVGNKEIHLENIFISNLSSHPVEIIGINNPNGSGGAYGSAMQAGPIGDILQITHITQNGKYKGTSLSDSQMIIATSSLSHKGTTSITSDVIEWATTGSDINTAIGDQKKYYVGGGDSMGHTMKGNLGLFISGGSKISGNNIQITDIHNKGKDVGTHAVLPPTKRSNLGASAVNILLTACDTITFTNTNAHQGQPTSDNPGNNEADAKVEKIITINDCTEIIIS